MARPVVVSAAPATGLDAEDGRDCAVAADGEAFCSRVIALLDDPARGTAMGAAARDCVLRAYSWSAHLRMLDWLLEAPPGTALAARAELAPAPAAAIEPVATQVS